MTRSIPLKYPLLLLCFLTFLEAGAQLKADFTPNKPGGCAPLTLTFTNTSNASSKATYEWNFGNGNTSALKNPGAVFLEGKAYTVTLTVRDGNQSASKTSTINVYKKPVVAFTVSEEKGCAPLPAGFTTTALPGDGTITQYFWDYGDGSTEQTMNSRAAHTYVAEQQPSVSLTVTNSFGCQSTLVKPKMLTVLPELKATFSTDKKVLCSISEAVRFSNSSSGPGTLTYNWAFGDGDSATEKDPAHVFRTEGIYTIRLKVTSSVGCTAENIQDALVNAADFRSDFDTPTVLCKGAWNEYGNKSTPVADYSVWTFGDGTSYSTSGSGKAYQAFPTTGPSTVTLVNTYGTCKDSITKTVQVREVPELKGFLVDITATCGAPVLVKYRDTTAGAVSWEWNSWPSSFRSSEQAPAYTYEYDNYYFTQVKVTNEAGCSATDGKSVYIQKPTVTITSPDASPSGEIRSCGPGSARFSASGTQEIRDYLWDFGDGTTSREAAPRHDYTKFGDYRVKLTYITADWCSGTAEYPYLVLIRQKVKADFSASVTETCGNTPVTFTNLSGQTVYYQWNFGDGFFQASTGQMQTIQHPFDKEGTYTVSLIATDLVCSDTMIKVDYIKVAPPFPKISGYKLTCEGTRGTVTFSQASRLAQTWTWDYGDGTVETLAQDVPQVAHTYTKTGSYWVKLTTTNGACSVSDQVAVTVVLRQKPVISADRTEVCTREEHMTLSIANLERKPNTMEPYLLGFEVYHNDWTRAISQGGGIPAWNSEPITYGMRDFMTPGKEGLRVVVRSGNDCLDTSNLIALKLKGPTAGFRQNYPDLCNSGSVAYLEDTSRGNHNVPITKRDWNFGDGTSRTLTNGEAFTHNFQVASIFYAQLKVTDAEGCTDLAQGWIDTRTHTFRASFSPSATTVAPGTAVQFTNTSVSWNQNQTTYKWLLGDGTEAGTFHAEHVYPAPGTYRVKLIATNTAQGCTDTATVTIVVKYVNAAFTYQKTYISNSLCPPVLVRLTNKSMNYDRITWDFGDSTIVHNQPAPSHVYTEPGTYRITVTTYSDNGTEYTYRDSIVIHKPVARLSADKLSACTDQTVTLRATALHAATYTWDFGDGTVLQSNDQLAPHQYSTAGVYNPRLVVEDASGCTLSADSTLRIVIDSLSLSLDALPGQICAPKEVFFQPAVQSVAEDQAQKPLSYHWNFGTGNDRDTANVKTPTFSFSQPGNYTVRFRVGSPYGCAREVTKTITALQGLGARISGPGAICQDDNVQFTGATVLPGQPTWQWIFHDGSTSAQQNPPSKKYDLPGTYPIQLVVNNGGCRDTVSSSITVNPNPIVTLSARQVLLCAGTPQTITAGGGATYSWSPAAGLNTTSGPTVQAMPEGPATYVVRVATAAGCTRTDSVRVLVTHPFVLQVTKDGSVCAGTPFQLKASGADAYRWLGNTASLSNAQVADPVARPSVSTTYTVIGSDRHGCFSDTAEVKVAVLPLPAVEAGAQVELMGGVPYTLKPVASPDVVRWNWTPGKYLSCTDCPAPETRPLEPVVYRVTVTNAAGCSATDTVSLRILCNGARVHIPNAFTPNNDGNNDVFMIGGDGIRTVKSLRIYNRWGELIFERRDFPVSDRGAAWNGTFKGLPVPAGSYVYFAEMSCEGQDFERRGTVTVVY